MPIVVAARCFVEHIVGIFPKTIPRCRFGHKGQRRIGKRIGKTKFLSHDLRVAVRLWVFALILL